MGYRSQVQFKTTSEGFAIAELFNSKITTVTEKPLRGATIHRTESGFYRVSFDDVKWYDTYEDVKNFERIMKQLDDQDIPYKFIRLGEDIDDIEVRENYTDDMPEELIEFNPDVSIYDKSEGDYEELDTIE